MTRSAWPYAWSQASLALSPTNSSKEHLNTENSTKLLLNASRVHQAPRKAAHCLQKEVGKNIKDKKRDKRGRDGALSWEARPGPLFEGNPVGEELNQEFM